MKHGILGSTILLLAYFYWLLRNDIAGEFFTSLMFVGALCNQSAILLNGFKMPVRGRRQPPTRTHKNFDKSTRLWFLCDILRMPDGIWSIGDVLIYLGSIPLLLVTVDRAILDIIRFFRH